MAVDDRLAIKFDTKEAIESSASSRLKGGDLYSMRNLDTNMAQSV